MKYALASLGNTSILVTADGNPVPHRDSPEWTFHILPKLYLPNFSDIEPPETIKLKVTSPELGDAVRPNTEIVVRQPYPNPDFFVAGTAERKMGWQVKSKTKFTTIHLVFDWEFSPDGCLAWKTGISRLRHELEFKLEPTGRGHVYSMDGPSCQNGLSSVSEPISVIDERDFELFNRVTFSPDKTGHPNPPQTICDAPPTTQRGCPVLSRKDLGHGNEEQFSIEYISLADFSNQILIKQLLSLPSCAWSDLVFDEFEQMRLLRDIEQTATFTKYLEDHRRNACCEIPALVVIQAIALAFEVPFRQGSLYFSNYEAHPAMICLSQWWNQNAPISSYRCAAHAKIWVRVEDNDEYWCGYYEEPNRSVKQGVKNPESVARWGNFLLFEFAKASDQIYFDDGCLVCPSVDGDVFEMVDGLEKQEYHPAWYGLVALEQFPSRFPAAWRALCEAIEG